MTIFQSMVNNTNCFTIFNIVTHTMSYSTWNLVIHSRILNLLFGFWYGTHYRVQWIHRIARFGLLLNCMLHNELLHMLYLTVCCGFTSIFIPVCSYLKSVCPEGLSCVQWHLHVWERPPPVGHYTCLGKAQLCGNYCCHARWDNLSSYLTGETYA